MKQFIIDTSTSVYSMAIANGKTLLAENSGVAGPSTAARLAPAMTALFAGAGLTPADMDFFTVTNGPGAFTGLRVGVSLVKGLACATGKPVLPVSSLSLLALNAAGSPIPVCPMFDARKGEVYTALYDFTAGGGPVIPEAAVDPAVFLVGLQGKVLFLGDGAVRYRDLILDGMGHRAQFADAGLNNPRAAAGIAMALDLFTANAAIPQAELLPRYLRFPEAELSRR